MTKLDGDEGDPRATGSATQTLDRAIQLVRFISASRGAGMGLSDLVRASGLTKPTARRLLLSLIDNGLIEQDEQNRLYHLGLETYMFGVIADERFGIQRLAADSLVRLAAASGDAALLSVHRGLETICLAREEGSYPLRSHVLQAGDRHPLGAGAAGVAMLAALPDEQVEEVLSVHEERLIAAYQLPEELRRQVAETRRSGYALNAGYVFKGSWGVAVAFRDLRSNTHAALTIAGVESRFTGSRIQELVNLLQDEKKRLEQFLSKRSGPLPSMGVQPVAASPTRQSGRKPIQKGDESHV